MHGADHSEGSTSSCYLNSVREAARGGEQYTGVPALITGSSGCVLNRKRGWRLRLQAISWRNSSDWTGK